MTVVPEQEPGQVTPAAGGETPAAEPTTPAAEPAQPFKAFASQQEYEAHFGTRATEARKSLAKKYGYDSLEAMDQAMQDYKTRTDAEKTELQKKDEELERLRPAASENLTLKQERAADRALIQAGVDGKKLDDVMVLLKAKGIPMDEAGAVDSAALTTQVEALLTLHPYFKGAGVTIGTGSNPGNPAGVLPEKNPWSKEHRNLTAQAHILNTDPALAARMQKAAK